MTGKPTLLVLAAGMGSRYGSLKQLDAFGPHGETLIEYAVYDAQLAGFGRVVFVIRREIEKEFTDVVVARTARFLPVDLVFQELTHLPITLPEAANRRKPWGTGHAVWSAAAAIREPFGVINADDFYGSGAFKNTVANWQQTTIVPNDSWCLVGYALADTLSPHGAVSRALCETDAQNNLKSIRELKEIKITGTAITAVLPDGQLLDLTGKELVSMNFWGFTPAVFPVLEKYFTEFLKQQAASDKAEFYLSEAVNTMLQNHEASIRVLPAGGKWMGVTYPDDKPAVKTSLAHLVAQGAYPSPLN